MIEPYRIFIGVLVGMIPIFLMYSINSSIDCLEIPIKDQEKCYEIKNTSWFATLPVSVLMGSVALRGLGFEQHYYERPCGKCGKILTIGTNPCSECGERLFWLPKRQDITPRPLYSWNMKERERMQNEAIVQRYDSMPFLTQNTELKDGQLQ